jgi:hypothetical protein
MADDYDDDLHAARQKAAQLAQTSVDHHPSGLDRKLSQIEPVTDFKFKLFEAGPGWRLFSTRRAYNTDPEPALREPVGGIVVEVRHGRQLHPETGEIADLTVYRCLNTWRLADPWVHLEGDEIDGQYLAGVDRLGCWHAIVWLLGQVHTRRRAPLSSDLDYIGDAWRLTRAMA